MKSIWFAAFLGLGLSGCAHHLDEQSYQAYLQNPAHGLRQEMAVERTSLTCTYRPVELLVAQDLRTYASAVNPATVDSIRRTYAGKLYVSLSLAYEGSEIENQVVNDRTAYAQAITYLNTDIAQDVFLTVPGQDSVAALAASYPRRYGATGRSTVLLVFDAGRLPVQHGFRVTFRDRLFGLGQRSFVFRAGDLAALPALSF